LLGSSSQKLPAETWQHPTLYPKSSNTFQILGGSIGKPRSILGIFRHRKTKTWNSEEISFGSYLFPTSPGLRGVLPRLEPGTGTCGASSRRRVESVLIIKFPMKW